MSLGQVHHVDVVSHACSPEDGAQSSQFGAANTDRMATHAVGWCSGTHPCRHVSGSPSRTRREPRACPLPPASSERTESSGSHWACGAGWLRLPTPPMLPGVAKVAARMSDWPGPHLLQVRHQVVGDAAGILSDATGRVRADGIKVAEQADVQLRMGLRAVA